MRIDTVVTNIACHISTDDFFFFFQTVARWFFFCIAQANFYVFETDSDF